MFFVAAFLTFMAIGGFPSFVEDMKVCLLDFPLMSFIQVVLKFGIMTIVGKSQVYQLRYSQGLPGCFVLL